MAFGWTLHYRAVARPCLCPVGARSSLGRWIRSRLWVGLTRNSGRQADHRTIVLRVVEMKPTLISSVRLPRSHLPLHSTVFPGQASTPG